MDTETITFNQALVVLFLEKGEYDGTNVVPAFAKAQDALRRRGHVNLDKAHDWEYVDSELILLLETGKMKI